MRADPFAAEHLLPQTRDLGLVVIRGTSVMTLAPEDGTMEIENPFEDAAGEDDVDAAAAAGGSE